ncbi:unnamed protein product [Cylicostephanus goldi]|uniref:Uncharacterized protein n=1 Tax=Cylicostephanus goldi TaxID=71465 RepID=A0A3P7MZE7_CYLGO|nr:unnamed protein product [Cylicostephanus goldi]
MVDFPDGKDIDNLVENPLLEPVEGPVGLPPSPPFPSSAENSLYETCLALACDPSGT